MEQLQAILTRLFKLVRTLAGVHLEFAQREAARDLGRVLGGVLLLVVAAVFAVCTLLLLDAAIILLLHDSARMTWVGAALATAGGNVGLCVLLALVGAARVKKPLLKETRGLVKKTVSALNDA